MSLPAFAIRLALTPISATLPPPAEPSDASEAPLAGETVQPADEPTPTESSEPSLQPVPIGLDLLPGVSASPIPPGQDDRDLSLGLLGTYAGGVDGLELSPLLGVVRTRVDGVQLTGGLNLVGGSLDGFQAAGGANIVADGVDGFQTAGALNVAAGGVDGFQLAGLANIAQGEVDGMQLAGALNLSDGPVDGPQIAGAMNLASGVEGVQIAPFNLSTGDVDGVQIGLVNIAKDSEVSIGLVNVIYEGRTHVDIAQASTGFVEAALKHGGRRFHSIYGGGLRPYGPCPEWSVMLGAGGHFPIGDRLFVDTDLLVRHVSPLHGLLVQTNTLGTARAVAGLQLFDQIAITGGLTANTLVSSVQDGRRYSAEGHSSHIGNGLQARSFPGVQLGVQLF